MPPNAMPCRRALQSTYRDVFRTSSVDPSTREWKRSSNTRPVRFSAEFKCRGMQGLLVRIARHLNSALKRTGRVFEDRFHSRVLGSTLDVRNTLRYVLNNARRHRIAFHGIVDPYSSAAWFIGWRDRPPAVRSAPIATPRSWQLLSGWWPHGRLDPEMTPGAATG